MSSNFICGSGRLRGKRQYMEDRECIYLDINVTNDKVNIDVVVTCRHETSKCFSVISALTMITESIKILYRKALIYINFNVRYEYLEHICVWSV